MIASLLRGEVPVGTAVTLQGWVRTRRDSKAGVSFINVHDGSGFHPIQVVAANTLPNYENEVLRLTSGASVPDDGSSAMRMLRNSAGDPSDSSAR